MAKAITKSFYKIIPVELYHSSVLVIMGYDKDDACSIIDHCGGGNYLKKAIRKEKAYDGLSIQQGNSGKFCLYMPKMPKTNKDIGDVHHEIFHIVTYIMERIGIKFDVNTSGEAYAYLMGYLSEEIVYCLL